MNVEELAESALDTASRILRRITMDDAAAAARMFEVLMGKDVEPRRDFIVKHSREYGHTLDI